jgi:3-deoxy-D-manno-octulosonic-acid transferase
MHPLYNFLLLAYYFLIRVASVFNKKARAWIAGRRDWQESLSEKISGLRGREIIWFHCASLGEFEQGRPLIEELRRRNPEYRIILSFFSPSGFTVRKNYQNADAVVYLPLDTPSNARLWIETVKPVMAFFIKYEYWFNFLKELKGHQIPVVFASAVFRKEQLFFQWYGSWFRSQLDNISWFYVQNEASGEILQSLGFGNVTISGDTRFDRVSTTAANAIEFPLIGKFCGNYQIILGGSTWPEDEAILIPFIRENAGRMKFILATHDVSESRIHSLETSLGVPFILYSALNEENAESAGVLIIDTVGILSQLYRYARLAFIGGAFGSGLHNILEAVAFGIPVFFGPKHDKFWEAAALIKSGGAFSVSRYDEFRDHVLRILPDQEEYKRISRICRDFIQVNRGATNIILDGMKDILLTSGGKK